MSTNDNDNNTPPSLTPGERATLKTVITICALLGFGSLILAAFLTDSVLGLVIMGAIFLWFGWNGSDLLQSSSVRHDEGGNESDKDGPNHE